MISKKAMMGDKEAAERLTDRGELLQCPCCGGEARFKILMVHEQEYVIELEFHIACSDCDLHTETYFMSVVLCGNGGIGILRDKRKDAKRDWNTRPQLLTKEQIEALERIEEK